MLSCFRTRVDAGLAESFSDGLCHGGLTAVSAGFGRKFDGALGWGFGRGVERDGLDEGFDVPSCRTRVLGGGICSSRALTELSG